MMTRSSIGIVFHVGVASFTALSKFSTCFAKLKELKFGVLSYQVLIKMLPNYYQHVSRYENSLVTKFFGVHCVKPVGGVKVCDRC